MPRKPWWVSEQDVETRKGVAFSWFMLWTVFYIFNLINDAATTYKADEFIPSSRPWLQSVAIFGVLVFSTILSGVSAAAAIYLNLYKQKVRNSNTFPDYSNKGLHWYFEFHQLLILVPSSEFHYRFSPHCGTDTLHTFNRTLPQEDHQVLTAADQNVITTDQTDPAAMRASQFQMLLRKYESLIMASCGIAIFENIIQTMVLFAFMTCEPSARGYEQLLRGFQATCFVNFLLILGCSVMYVLSHDSWGYGCRCVYPRQWCRKVFGIQALAQIVLSFVGCFLVIVAMARPATNCLHDNS
ncbi:predicted protein [Nematostella vectensis]|uniref:Uncharacterized protein n=1 Tax=Nematostella vectensis TaxID=45351 RepID=A7RL53_NEMVE|nr:predicted protein [Nematostella vectensis]|eukprot:XP_001639866.1 predicted protein [Nematostella vectensis]